MKAALFWIVTICRFFANIVQSGSEYRNLYTIVIYCLLLLHPISRHPWSHSLALRQDGRRHSPSHHRIGRSTGDCKGQLYGYIGLSRIHSYLFRLATCVARRKPSASQQKRGACSAPSLAPSATLLLSRRGEQVEGRLGESAQQCLRPSSSDMALAISTSKPLKKDLRSWRVSYSTLSNQKAFQKLVRHSMRTYRSA